MVDRVMMSCEPCCRTCGLMPVYVVMTAPLSFSIRFREGWFSVRR